MVEIGHIDFKKSRSQNLEKIRRRGRNSTKTFKSSVGNNQKCMKYSI